MNEDLLKQIEVAKLEAVKLSRRLAQHTDLRMENMWGEFCASIDWTRNKIEALSLDQNQEKEKLLAALLKEFHQILLEPGSKETPACIMAGVFLLEFFEKIEQL